MMDKTYFLELLQNRFDEAVITDISQHLEESKASVRKAVKVLIPFVSYKISDVQFLNFQPESLEDMSFVFRQLFGNRIGDIANAVASHCGLSNRSVYYLLECVVRETFAFIKEFRGENLDEILKSCKENLNFLEGYDVEKEFDISNKYPFIEKIVLFLKWFIPFVLLILMGYVMYQTLTEPQGTEEEKPTVLEKNKELLKKLNIRPEKSNN